MFLNLNYLIILWWAWIEWPTQEQLGHNASQGPHVDGLAERKSQNDFRRSIISTLKVGVAHGFRDVRCRPEIDDFDSVGLSDGIEQHDVFGFQVGMDQAELLQLEKGCEDLQN